MSSNIVYYETDNTSPSHIVELSQNELELRYRNLLESVQRLKMDGKSSTYEILSLNVFNDFSCLPTSYSKRIAEVIKKIKKRQNEVDCQIKITQENPPKIIINMENVLAIANLIIKVLEKCGIGKTKEATYLAFKKIPKNYTVNNINVSQYLDEFSTIKIIEFAFSSSEICNSELSLNIYSIWIFVEFLHALFPYALEAIIDLNVYQINRRFNNLNNDPSMITEKEILKMTDDNKKVFLMNYIITRYLNSINSILQLNIKLYDSYLLEIHNFFSGEFYFNKGDNKILSQSTMQMRSNQHFTHRPGDIATSMIFKDVYIPTYTGDYVASLNNNMILMSNFLQRNDLRKLNFDFNALDPLLFSNVIYIISNSKSVNELSLEFFPKDNDINLRKILLNGNYYNYYENDQSVALEEEYDDHDTFIDLANISKGKGVKSYLKYDKIPKKLFNYFNQNMINLLIVLEKQIEEIMLLRLNLCCREDLEQYDTYQFSNSLFLFSLLRILQKNASKTKLNTLEIEFNDNNKKCLNETFKREHCGSGNEFDLTGLSIYQMKLSMNDITQIIPFEKFPVKKLSTLIMQRLSIEDFNDLLLNFKKNQMLFPCIDELKLEFDYCEECPIDLLKDFFSKYLPSTCTKIIVNIPNQINLDNIIAFLKCYSSNGSPLKKYLLLEIECAIDHSDIGQPSFRTNFGKSFIQSLPIFNINYHTVTFPSLYSLLCEVKVQPAYIYLSMIYAVSKKVTSKKIDSKIAKLVCKMIGTVRRKVKVTFKN